MSWLLTLSETIAGHLWSISWQVSILIALIWLINRLSFRASSLFRYWLWCIVLVRLCIPFKLSLPAVIPQFVRKAASMVLPDYRFVNGIENLSQEPRAFSHITPLLNSSRELLETSLQSSLLASITFYVWCVILLLIGVYISLRFFRISQRLKRCSPVIIPEINDLLYTLSSKIGISKSVRLFFSESEDINTPLAVGILQPRIYIPHNVKDWSSTDLKPILLHELAHIKRHDLLVNWIQLVLQAVFFFHPLVWYVNRRIRSLREEVCDDIAISMLGLKREFYSHSIMKVVEIMTNRPKIKILSIGLADNRSSIERRISRIMQTNYTVTVRMRRSSIVFLVAIALTGLLLSCGKPLQKHTSVRSKQITLAIAWGRDLKPPTKLKTAVNNLTDSIDRYANIKATVEPNIFLDSDRIFEMPILFISSEKTFSLTKKESSNLEKYLRGGGFAFIENATPQFEWSDSEAGLRQMLRDTLGSDAKFIPVPDDYPLYDSIFTFLDGAPSGGEELLLAEEYKKGTDTEKLGHYNQYIEGIWLDDRLVAIYSDKGYFYRWCDTEYSHPQKKFGVNIVVFALDSENKVIHRHHDE